MTSVPDYVGTGDPLYLIVKDSNYSFRYASKADTSAVVVGERAALYGATDIATLAAGIPAHIAEPAEALLPEDWQLHSDLTGSIVDKSRASMTYQELLNLRRQLLSATRSGCEALSDTAAAYFLANPDQYALVAMLSDPKAHELADSLERHPIGDHITSLVARGFREPLPDEEIDTLRARIDTFGRKLTMLGVILSAPPGWSPNRSGLDTLFRKLEPCVIPDSSAAIQVIDKRIRDLVARGRAPSDSLPKTQGRRALSIAGLDLSPFARPTTESARRIRAFHEDLTVIAQRTRTVFAAGNRLPAFGLTRKLDTLHVGTYWRPIHLKVSPVRGPRFPELTAPPQVSFKEPEGKKPASTPATTPPASGATSATPPATMSSGGVTITVVAGEKKEAAPAGPSLATAEIDVLQRTRFHAGVGLMWSRLKTEEYSTRADTMDGVPGTRVSVLGESPDKYVPILTLGYTLLPLNGKIYGAQAYPRWTSARRYLNQAGLSLALGLSLKNPLEQIKVGVQSEPIPGINVGYGRHFGYNQFDRTDATGFLAETGGNPVREKWSSGEAWTVTLDGSTVLGAFGKLIGLK